jgi:hypothetical protein
MKANHLPVLLLFCCLQLTCLAQSQPGYRMLAAAADKYKSGHFDAKDTAAFYYNSSSYKSIDPLHVVNYVNAGLLYATPNSAYPSMDYDSAYAYISVLLYAEHYIQQKFDNNSNIIQFAVDRNESGNIASVRTDTMVYTNNKIVRKADDYLSQTWHYNAASLVDTQRIYVTQNQMPVLISVNTYEYNQAGNVLKQQHYDPLSQMLFTTTYGYNSAGLLEFEETTDPQNQPSKYIGYTYTLSGQIEESTEKRYLTATQTYENKKRLHYSYDINDKLLQRLEINWYPPLQAWDTFMRGNFTYNTYGLVSAYESERYNKFNQTWGYAEDTSDVTTSHRMRFYYEQFWPTNIASQPPPNTQIQLYPNPATHVLTIDASFEQPQSFTATITDMQGRVWQQWNEQGTTRYHRTISTSDLAPGNYILQLGGSKTKFTVVSH